MMTLFDRVLCRRLIAQLAIVLYFLLQALHSSAETLRVNQTKHPLDAFAVNALRVALGNVEQSYDLQVSRDEMTQARVVENLEKRKVDVMWLATNAKMEEQLQPIRFPLLKGLLGHRISIINPQSQSKFDQVSSLDDLKRLEFGQGQGWPDVEILRSNGLNVITTSKYQNLFYMVEGGRFDGFPRGVLEPWAELASRPELGLTVEKSLVLIYKLPFYLYVRKDQSELASIIFRGFEVALENGTYDEFYFNNELVKDAISRSGLKDRQAYHLNNPVLTPKTPLGREEFWLDLEAL